MNASRERQRGRGNWLVTVMLTAALWGYGSLALAQTEPGEEEPVQERPRPEREIPDEQGEVGPRPPAPEAIPINIPHPRPDEEGEVGPRPPAPEAIPINIPHPRPDQQGEVAPEPPPQSQPRPRP